MPWFTSAGKLDTPSQFLSENFFAYYGRILTKLNIVLKIIKRQVLPFFKGLLFVKTTS